MYFHFMSRIDPNIDKPATPDQLWKELIKKRFRDFVAFYKPDMFPEIVFEKTEFLDKELLSITGKSHKGLVDVLAKVHLKSNAIEFILLHVEVQGYPEEQFNARMFGYFIRIWDRYRKPVSALAIITPGFGKGKASAVFSFESFGTKLRYEYGLFDVRTLKYASCLRSTNPVAVAAGILASSGDVPLWKKKYEVMRRLGRLGLTPQEMHLLIGYVDRHSLLKGKALEQFDAHVVEEPEEVKMILTSFEEKAIKKGIEQGVEQGIEKGIEKGKLDDAQKMLTMGISIADIRKITGLPLNQIEALRKKRKR